MLVGVVIAAQLAWPILNFDHPWLTFSHLRPLHTNAVIFAFGGSALFATSYYIVQRTCHVELFAPKLAAFTFWGWAIGYRSGSDNSSDGIHSIQRVCRINLAD